MHLIRNLETYIAAQKGVGVNAFVFSIGMMATAMLLHFYASSSLALGIRNGTFVIGLLLMLMGVGLRFSQEKILQEKKALYETDQVECKRSEIECISLLITTN